MYREGNGIAQSNTLAHMWYNIAASHGFDVAQKRRDAIAQEMTPTEIQKAERLARTCVQKKYRGC
jgi:TPR repeat protein